MASNSPLPDAANATAAQTQERKIKSFRSFNVTPAQQKAAEQAHADLKANAVKIQAFFRFLKFEDELMMDKCLGRSGRSPDCLMKAPEGGPKVLHTAVLTSTSYGRKVRNSGQARAQQIDSQRKEVKDLTQEEIIAKLKDVFDLYCDRLLYCNTGRHEISIVGFCRLLRDCRLLDNKLHLVQADVIFTQVDAEADVGTIPGDMHLSFEEFQVCLKRLIRVKFPNTKDVDDALLILTRKYILPFQRGFMGQSACDGLYERSSLNLLRQYQKQLKRMFSWYAMLEDVDPQKVSWNYVRKNNCTVSGAGFLLMLLNFQVLPCLMSKQAALNIFTECEAANDGDESADAQLFPAFLETLAMIAVEISNNLPDRIRAASSPEEMRTYKAYISACPEPLHTRLINLHSSISQRRQQERYAALVPKAPSPDADYGSEMDQDDDAQQGAQELGGSDQHADLTWYQHQAQMLASRASQYRQQADFEQQMKQLQRREEIRQQFALARLRNFYKDVRPAQHTAPGGIAQPLDGTAEDADGEEEVEEEQAGHISFFSDSREIKTPRPIWRPSTNFHRGSYATLPSPHSPGDPMQPLRNSAVFDSMPSFGQGAPAAHISPHAAHSTAHKVLQVGKSQILLHQGNTFLPPRPDPYARAKHGAIPGLMSALTKSSPKGHYYLKVKIEEKDESEAITKFADTLPNIRSTDSGAQLHATSDASQLSTLALQMRESAIDAARANTAPAALSALSFQGSKYALPDPAAASKKYPRGKTTAPQVSLHRSAHAVDQCVHSTQTPDRRLPINSLLGITSPSSRSPSPVHHSPQSHQSRVATASPTQHSHSPLSHGSPLGSPVSHAHRTCSPSSPSRSRTGSSQRARSPHRGMSRQQARQQDMQQIEQFDNSLKRVLGHVDSIPAAKGYQPWRGAPAVVQV